MILVGRSTRDAEIISTKNDTKLASFCLAVNEYNKNTKEEKSFFYDILVFGKNIEKVAEAIKKGDAVLVQGKPEVDAFISKKDNQPKASVKIVADTWRVLK